MQYCRGRYEPGVDPNGKEVHGRPVYKRSADSISPKSPLHASSGEDSTQKRRLELYTTNRNSFCAFVLNKILVCVYYVEAPTSTAVKTAETKLQWTPNSLCRQNGGVAKKNMGLIAGTPNQTQ